MQKLYGILALLVLGGCGRALPVQDPTDQEILAYPGSLQLSADGNTAYVVSTNFDQRYSSGWVSSFDIGALLAASDRKAVLRRQAFVASMGGALALTADARHALLPHRGRGLLTLLDISDDGRDLTCQQPGGSRTSLSRELQRTSCDAQHVLALQPALAALAPQAAQDARLSRDPYAAVALPGSPTPRLAVGLLSATVLLTVGLPAGGGMQLEQLIHLPSLYASSLRILPAQVLPGGGSLPPQLLGANAEAGRNGLFTFDLPNLLQAGSAAQAAPTAHGDVAASTGSQQIRAVAAAPDGQHLYAISRAPNALVVLRRSTPPVTPTPGSAAVAGAQQLTVTAAAALDRVRLGDVLFVPRAAGALVVASGIDTNTLYFFDPQGDTLAPVGSLTLRRAKGPLALAQVQQNGRNVLLATSFFSHGLVAVDITDASTARFTVLFEEL